MATSIITDRFICGQESVAVAGTAQALDTAARRVSAVMIIAHDNNTGRIFVGGSDVDSSTQRGLAAGESVSLGGAEEPPFNIGEVFIDSSVSGEGVDFYATIAKFGG